MFEKVYNRFDHILQILNKNKINTKKVEHAFDFAMKMHKNQLRKDGQPYISHPVEVGIILSDLGFDDDVICAGLLHDVIEDCGCTIETLKNEFNERVAELVDSVSAIEGNEYKYNAEAIYESEDFVKLSADEQTFNKLIAFGKKNPLAFCIKFADRLHNLRSIGVFERSKQLAKVRETEQWLLPIAKILHATYFHKTLANECFKVVYNINDCLFFKHYKEYHISNEKNVDNFILNLKIAFSDSGIKEIFYKDIYEYEVFNNINKLINNSDIRFISQGKILKVSNYNIFLLHDKKNKKNILNEILLKIKNKLSGFAQVIDARQDLNNQPYFVLQDNFRNKYNLFIMSKQEYVRQIIGTLDGQLVSFIDDDQAHTIATEYIKVATRSGEILYMPANSTALDFAFKIHRDIGLGFKYAIINGNKTKYPPYTKLNNGDQITVFYDRDKDNNIIDVCELKWFAYVNNDLSKKFLIKYFEKKLNYTRYTNNY